MQEFFETKNGRVITDEYFSDKMYKIKSLHPEKVGEEDSGYEWSEIGMAGLFGELYKEEAR